MKLPYNEFEGYVEKTVEIFKKLESEYLLNRDSLRRSKGLVQIFI